MKSLILNEMTWPELEREMRNIKIVIIPVGSCEQHGPNTTFATDTARAENFCKLLAERMGNKVLVVPSIAYGMSPHHYHFPGTISLTVHTMINLLCDIACSLSRHGFSRFMYVNGHGGNRSILQTVVVKLKYEHGITAYWTGMGTPFARSKMPDLFDFSEPIGHACEVETSQLLYLAPEFVRENRVKGSIRSDGLFAKNLFIDGGAAFDWYTDASENGALGDARKASVECGKQMTDIALENIENLINTLIDS